MIRRTCRVALLLGLAVGPSGRADDTDILSAGVQPNVLILFDSSGSMNDPVAGQPKIVIAKQVVTNLIASTNNVRFGVMKFRSHGAAMVAEIGTNKTTMINAVNAMSLTSVGTPLGDQLYDGGLYFKGSFQTYSSPIDVECRRNIVIVVSDGLENNSNLYLPDEATLRRTQDHATGLSGTQNVTVHTVGFGIDPGETTAANAILEAAAANGGGLFFSTDNGAQLQVALESIMSSLAVGTFSFAAGSVPSTSLTGATKVFQASFRSESNRPFWRGYLGAYQRDANGAVQTDGDGVPLSSALTWEAGQVLSTRAASSRAIYTVIGGTRQSFDKSNGALTSALLGVGTSGERDKVIDFVRGIDAFDEDNDSNTGEARAWKLGDIMHASPVLITPPVMISGDPAYQAFRAAQAGRTTVVLVGANDGMLHAFRESDGAELWGFIPPDLLGRLKELTPTSGVHPYYVDSSPVLADIKLSGAYRTVALFGERRGGRRYHALDVTDTTDPAYLFSFTDAMIGETWFAPVIGRIRMSGGAEKDVAFFGGGYDTAQNNATGKVFYAIDLASGTKLWEYRNDGTGDDRQFMNFSLAGAPTALDLDGNGFVDRVYIGDVGGQLWKFDMSSEAILSGGLVSNWSGKRLFAAAPSQANPPPAGPWNPTQAIYAAPAAAQDESGQLWLYFGTGDLNHPLNSGQNRFYGLRDSTGMSNGGALTESSLVDVTSTDASGGNGWYVRLQSTEKVLYGADVFDGNVFFTTFLPATTAVCSAATGTATLYAMRMTSGYAGIDWATGEELSPTDSSETRSVVVGSGIPHRPALVTTIIEGALNVSVVTGTTDLQLVAEDAPEVALRRILYWREVF